jgi:hypothetical protein
MSPRALQLAIVVTGAPEDRHPELLRHVVRPVPLRDAAARKDEGVKQFAQSLNLTFPIGVDGAADISARYEAERRRTNGRPAR